MAEKYIELFPSKDPGDTVTLEEYAEAIGRKVSGLRNYISTNPDKLPDFTKFGVLINLQVADIRAFHKQEFEQRQLEKASRPPKEFWKLRSSTTSSIGRVLKRERRSMNR
jgi:hypothetical protein